MNTTRWQANKKERMAKLETHHERRRASVTAWRKETTVCHEATEAYPEKMEVKPEDIESKTVHEEVPKEEVAVKSFGALIKRHRGRHLAARRRGKPKGTDPGQWWVPEEIGCRQQRDDPPCKSGTAQGTRSSWTRPGQCSTRDPERPEVREESSGATGRQTMA
jgi:hypothetical protein